MAEDRTSIDRLELRTERGVAQYQRLASLLRHRIGKGEYPIGAHLPPMTQLAADLGVAVVSVRQAFDLLSGEGLIHSQRGIGTRVVALPLQAGDIEVAINDLYAAPEELAFQILEMTQGARVPVELLGTEDRAADDNVCVRKIHTYSGEPFCLVEIYIPAEIWRSLPKDTVKKRKVLAAVLDAFGSRCKRVRQRTTVMPADYPVCELLNIPFSSPVAKMVRRLVDARGNVLYAGVTWYRGDRFVSDIDFPVSALKTVSGLSEPQPRAVGARKRG